MGLPKETRWLCEHASSLEKFSGKWIAFSVERGVVSDGKTLAMVMRKMRAQQAIRKPFVFHVPSKDELQSPRSHAKL